MLYNDLLRRMGIDDVSDELLYKIYSEYARLPTYLFDDVLPTLQALQDCGFRLGILSNHTTAVRAAIEQLVNQYIPSASITISEETGIHKPNPDIYRLAAKKLNTPPEKCIYVGDNLHVDAIGAVQFGGFSSGIWVDRHGGATDQTFPIGVARISNLAEIVDLYEHQCGALNLN